MASIQEIEKELNNTKNVISEIENAEVTGANQYVYQGKTYTQEQLAALAKPYKDRLKALEKIYSPYAEAVARLNRAKEVAKSPITESPTALSKAEASKAVKDAQELVTKATESLKKTPVPAFTAPPSPPTTSGTALTREQSEAMGQGRMGVEGGFGATVAKKPKPAVTDKTKTKTKVSGDKPPSGPGDFAGETKTVNGKTFTWNGTEWKPAGKLNTEQVINRFKQMFPTQAWLTEIDTAKYPQVRELLERAVVGEMWKTPQGLERFKTEWEATDFFTELRTDNQVKAVTSLVGDLGFDTVPFNSFLTKSMNMGWKGETLKAEVYKEVFRKDDNDAYVNPTAYARVKKSNEYLSVAKIGKEYFSEVADSDIETVLTGGMLVDDVQRKQRELAKTKYGHLSNLIEQGFTLKQLSDPFRQQAASLLERNIDDIDMGEANFEAAYNYGEPEKKRMMTTGEWEIMLRSDAKYGWDKTNNAKAEARTLASSIAQAFGKVI
jgi:hypothetical protein